MRIFLAIYIFYFKGWKNIEFLWNNFYVVSPGLKLTEADPEQSISPCPSFLIVRCARELSKWVTPVCVLQLFGLGFGK